MSDLQFAEVQRDALAEMVNIGMGQAGDRLARLFNTFIQLSVPRLELIQPRALAGALDRLCGSATAVIGTRQAFASHIRGEAVVFFTAESCGELAELVGYPGADRNEVLLDITNVLVGACIGGIAAQFALELALSPPSLLGEAASATRLLDAGAMVWQTALLSEVNFRVEARLFHCHLVTFWPDASLQVLVKAVDDLLAAV